MYVYIVHFRCGYHSPCSKASCQTETVFDFYCSAVYVYDTYFHITVPILNGTAAAESDEDPSHENDNDEDEGVSDSAVEASRTVFSRGCGNDNTYIKQKTILCCAY